jgi:hypothetical protein
MVWPNIRIEQKGGGCNYNLGLVVVVIGAIAINLVGRGKKFLCSHLKWDQFSQVACYLWQKKKRSHPKCHILYDFLMKI